MKDEIKEIINQLEIVARKHTIKLCEDGSKIETMPASVIDELRLNNYSSKILLDYITNLQEKNKRLKEENKELLERFSNKIEEFSGLIKENEKLKLAKDTKCASEILCECLNNVYKSRNEKANTLLDEMLERAYIDGKYIMYDYSTSELLEVKNALQGEDKDE